MSQSFSSSIRQDATRSSLLGKLKNLGDRDAWQEFFDLYWALVFNFAKRAGFDDSDAEDIVIETVAIVSQKINEFKYEREQGRFKTWLLTIARNRIGDRFKKSARLKRQGQTFALDELPADTHMALTLPDLEKIWDEEWRSNLIDMTLRRVRHIVGARQFQIFHSYVIQENNAAKVAAFFDISRNQVYMAKNRVGKIFESEYKLLAGKDI